MESFVPPRVSGPRRDKQLLPVPLAFAVNLQTSAIDARLHQRDRSPAAALSDCRRDGSSRNGAGVVDARGGLDRHSPQIPGQCRIFFMTQPPTEPLDWFGILQPSPPPVLGQFDSR